VKQKKKSLIIKEVITVAAGQEDTGNAFNLQLEMPKGKNNKLSTPSVSEKNDV